MELLRIQITRFTSTTNTISGTCGTSFTSSNFGVAVSLVAGQDANQWEIINPVYTYSPASGTLNGSTPVTCTVTGTVREKSYTLQYNVTDSNTGGVYATDYLILNSNPSGVSFNGGTAPLTQTISGKFSDTYNIVTTYSNVAGSNNDTVISSVSEGTFSGKIISGITGTLGDSAPDDVILSQIIESTTSAIAGPAQFRLTALTQSVQTVDDGDGVENKGITYTPYAQYKINNGPLNDITTLNQYILVAEGDVVALSYPDPTVATNQGYFVKTSFGTNIPITDGTSTVFNSFTAVADKSYDVTIEKTGGVTNRRNVSGRSITFTATESEACSLAMVAFNSYLSKPSTPLAPPTPWVPEVNDYTWADDYAYNAFADGWYRANLTVTQGGTLPTNPGKYQLLSNRVNAASACPAEGTAVFVLDNDITGTSNGYSLSTTYTVTLPGGIPGNSIPYTGAVTAVENSVITFTSTAQAFGSFVWESGPTFTPASGIVTATIQANAQVTATALVEGNIVSVAAGAVAGPHPYEFEACQDQNYDINIFYIGSSSGPTVGDVFYTDKNQGVLINPLGPGFYRFDNPYGEWFRIEDNAGTVSTVGTCPS